MNIQRGLHWPYCLGSCEGCLPELPPLPSEPLVMQIQTRPQDWALPAREILMARGAWSHPYWRS